MQAARMNPWTLPHHDSSIHAQIWHARAHARWLLSAGARTRLSMLLMSGTQAYSHWATILKEQGVELNYCTIEIDRPLPQALLQHRGCLLYTSPSPRD